MKKPIKYAVIILAIVAAIAGGIYYSMMPVAMRLTEIQPRVAELSFTEQGVVTGGDSVLVFAAVPGEIYSFHAWENMEVAAGDVLLTVDAAPHFLRYQQIEQGILGLNAQLENIDIEVANARSILQTTRATLTAELSAINAQAAQSLDVFTSQQEILTEQIRVQEVLISRHAADLELANENYQRATVLYQGGVVPRSEFEATRAASVAAVSALDAATAQLAVIAAGTAVDNAQHFEGLRAAINAQIAGIDAQLAQDTTQATRAQIESMIAVETINLELTMREIENTVITSPVAGTIATFHAQNTNFVNPALPIAEITTFGQLDIDVYVSTQDIGTIAVGNTVGITFRQRTGDAIFGGTVVDIDNSAVVRFTALGVEERKVRVRVGIEQPEGLQLGAGYGVDVTFYVFREEGQITVPRTAVFRAGGVDMVWVVQGGVAETRQVETGLELRTDVIIESGLAAGELVVNDANNQDLREGTRVVGE